MGTMTSYIVAFGALVALIVATAPPACGQPAGDGPRVVQMRLRPAPASEAKVALRLLPAPADEKPGDAAPRYRVAAKSLEMKPPPDAVADWSRGPIEEMPLPDVRSALTGTRGALDETAKAARCQKCDWDALPRGMKSALSLESLRHYRILARLIVLQVRLAIVEKQYEEAIQHAQTGFSMARDLAEDTELLQAIVGVAVGSLVAGQLEQFMQQPDAPSLHQALGDLPSPLVSMKPAIKRELANLKTDPRCRNNPVLQVHFRTLLAEPHARAKTLSLNLDRRIAALQCIEAIRLHARAHDGELPAKLTDITKVRVPNDPGTKKPFEYRATKRSAILNLPLLGDAPARDGVRYEITMVE